MILLKGLFSYAQNQTKDFVASVLFITALAAIFYAGFSLASLGQG
jgi:hypothetical protein